VQGLHGDRAIKADAIGGTGPDGVIKSTAPLSWQVIATSTSYSLGDPAFDLNCEAA
jgi:hypothetical protein